MSIVSSAVQSRWGFHPCEYTTYRKLKYLSLVQQRAVRMAHAWQRWKGKDPANRVSRRRLRNDRGQSIGYGPPTPLPEPRLCTVFAQKISEKCFVDKKGTYFKDGFLDDKVVVTGQWIAGDYAAARTPLAQAAAVRPLSHTIAEIDDLYEKARAWVEGQDVD